MPRTTVSSELLPEIERQQEYLDELPANYDYPVFNGRQAVESQRKSGYRDTARAAREIVDNAYEAGARNVYVLLERAGDRYGGNLAKHERRNAVSAIAFVDDGPGMLPQMVRFALTWGGGTHYKDPKRIGKFGFGLPNSSVNQTRRVEVYSRTSADQPWMMSFLDINDVPAHGVVTIQPAVEVPGLPLLVSKYLSKENLSLKNGTVVYWEAPDNLSYRMASELKAHLLEDFGVVYRELLEGFSIHVDGTTVEKTDPLFLTPGARYYVPPPNGAACTVEPKMVLKYYRDPDSGSRHVVELKSVEEINNARTDKNVLAVGTVRIRVVRFPHGFVNGLRVKDQEATDAHRRFEIRRERRGISFVRAGREIDTLDNFPRSARDIAAGLGNWPLLQGYAYHWAVEIAFNPELDEPFGIGNDKQTVRPIEDVWRALSRAEIDKLLAHETKIQIGFFKAERAKRAERERAGQETLAGEAAAQAKAVMGRNKPLPSERQAQARKLLQDVVARDASKIGGSTPTQEHLDAALRAREEEARKKKYLVEFFDSEGGVFLKPTFGNGLQRVARINRLHPFYERFYGPAATNDDPRLRNALDVLLFALVDGELESDGLLGQMYEHQREMVWSPFLKTGYKILDQLLRQDEQEETDSAAGRPEDDLTESNPASMSSIA